MTTVGFAEVFLNGPQVVSLWDAFDDAEDADADMVYRVVQSDGDACTLKSIESFVGTLTLTPICSGTEVITIRAADTGGLFVDATLTVHVNQ